MAWLGIRIEACGEVAETLADALLEQGALSVTIEDLDAGTEREKAQFGEPSPIAGPNADNAGNAGFVPALWDRSIIEALLPEETDPASIVAAAARASGLESPPVFRVVPVAEKDWVRTTQAQFEPIRISDRLWIVPSWHEPPDPQAINLILDPGMAFGTGTHPTTRLCLEWLEQAIRPGFSFLDYGCGSGILALAAARLGAERVCGADIDPQALTAARNNAVANGVVAQFTDAARPLRGAFDLVAANILSNPLRLLAPALCARLRSGGQLALSGILEAQAEELIACYAPFLPLEIFATREGWVCLTGVKP
ncbi:MAG: 50S ribosomal protein L11 methyltransferase [Betaproteobacteria bacterium]|nr:50S ribosomal protein L11 methyltransferase [Betaproteobacteria bacterium]